MGTFSGQLRPNEIYSGLFNMIIGQVLFDRIADGSELVDKAKEEAGLYGDTKLFYSADALHSHAWGNDSEAGNLLSLDRPKEPECQAITIDVFRQIRLTLDDYLSKRSWSTEGAFGMFNSIMEGMIGKSKRIYDVTNYNAFFGTAKGFKADSNEQKVEVSIATTDTPETEAKLIAQAFADLLVKMKTVSRDFNEYGQITKFGEAEIHIAWNSKYHNKIEKVDLPAIFHKEGLMDKFNEDILPEIYFGTPNASKVLAANNDGSYRAMYESEYTVSGSTVQLYAGESIPAGVDIEAGAGYLVNDTVIAKVYVKLPPYMSAFEVGSSFWNARSLTTNRYLTFGHNTLEVLKAFPFVTMYKTTPTNVARAKVIQ